MKILEAMRQRDRRWRLRGWIAVRAAQAGDDAGGAGQAVRRVRVLLQRGFALVLAGGKAVEQRDLGRAEGDGGGLLALAVARLHELQGHAAALAAMAASLIKPRRWRAGCPRAAGHGSSSGGTIARSSSAAGTSRRSDRPPRHRRSVGSEQARAHRFDARGRVELDHLDDAQRHGLGQAARMRAVGARD